MAKTPKKYLDTHKRWRDSSRGIEWRLRKTCRKYSMTLEDYDVLHEAQGYVCAICEKPETRLGSLSGEVQRLSIDHCHRTGRIRGLLCAKCNLGIGHFEDDVPRLKRIVEYLDES